jgi:hypothetical protein
MNAAVRAFKLAGGKHPCVRVSGDTIEVFEKDPNSTNETKSARTHAKIEEQLGSSGSRNDHHS